MVLLHDFSVLLGRHYVHETNLISHSRYTLFINMTQVKKLYVDQHYFNEPDHESHIRFSDKSLLVELMLIITKNP